MGILRFQLARALKITPHSLLRMLLRYSAIRESLSIEAVSSRAAAHGRFWGTRFFWRSSIMAFMYSTHHIHRLGIIWSADSLVLAKKAVETFALQINPHSR